MSIDNRSQISASTACSCSVKTARAESVGSIKEFMINTSTGQVDYVVLKVDDGFLNLGSKLLALPFESFEFNTAQDDVVIVKETKETLENAPGFDNDNWPAGPQAEFLHTMRSYYSEGDRSLYGRYDHQNRTFFDTDDRLDVDPDRISNREFGSGFLESDHRGDRQSDVRRGGDPLL
jgi:sporulation protein YlmC with PRC-barrel domain